MKTPFKICIRHGNLSKDDCYIWKHAWRKKQIVCKKCAVIYRKRWRKKPENYDNHKKRQRHYNLTASHRLTVAYLKKIAFSFYKLNKYSQITNKMLADTRKRLVERRNKLTRFIK